ncbi:MAG: hydroxymethylglutaryl-CoA reductase [Pseudomonadales bacterium]|jgi:hydroxymethylglutaryl-CoA reductase (NADPH)|uniref:hydroxymethylglutaryl-CoA reductase n=1 Tax=unclassified Ketobacter TaxID=2639109 RepID=UPI000C8AF5D8|nr:MULTISPECIES: hydroxymethylglutaryl-CoA reductase [unclassified Ketobacter]MAA60588.1 hydroxymethylglutaryl-CoA reductase [Pseudomonadales bacterium]MEC8810169.1 hydroxymethylglutaryl-CoA reductase [Pseudomonadota bacterium]TNC89985.1 MAG: hydroxymethylglutaryl-CoA reductase [Alcanivorax sp.]HAG95130.1 hydroxymethylglutaryl-CoA reductase [Gammaproteobacteria bacterium]MAQ26834.1 hydroxymethylglutaryl-CoA reductase [Pseudomonadales bacterium]|tara:strand:+ start:3003 stop:4172 length:1170 start_codon:yes stop_codon:yes gene_type:complete
MQKLPRDKENDYTREMASQRRDVVNAETGSNLEHVGSYSIDPGVLPGNIENFAGVAQVPLGFAGPMLVNGEHAKGEFYVPMATSEGTLVASYSRGMRLTREAGGITTTVVDDAMQRAPVFIFDNARSALRFGRWVEENFEAIKAKAEETTSSGKLRNIEQYTAAKMRWLRFNFTCGDAAGQNMVSKATRHACMWMLDQGIPGLENFSLAANFDTDKKHSYVNSLHTRGKRAVAEVTLPAQLVKDIMHTTPQDLFRQRQYSNMGALMAGSVCNGAHFANGITAMFIACGQDVANVAESSAGIVYSEVTEQGDYYFAATIPSLVVATYGGGTGLPTQRECLDVLGCYGKGGVQKFAEIVAATVLCGELSLAAAIVADEWVSSHDAYGRNRP